MSRQTNTNPSSTLLAAYPQLFVADIAASCAYFKQTLGFDTVFAYGEPPFYAQVMRGGARLNLRCVEALVFRDDIREREQLLSAYIPVNNMQALYHEYQAAGVNFQQVLEMMPWEREEFVVRDPDGNLICFGGV
ncbi:MAG TPA: VOC family protein [Burkholderiales bacterium]|nr:VOC family protein [Burkholderiales bacterium]